ncbi:2Fe-2S iron-sulfur cluster binding domain-containing protein [Halieaceae bacterium IMCC8485]|uniref:2Fe-2S iron-sulfur cluster binding domain-containing protein n=1 Tax=Candidatus Seongchinamella marina TaxID=2518990 RepID=A0ABT3SZM4_9GAMM|nr:2Fe-2S iron-sulfur cluster binding domain-containing protein [Candidatus Seongchinamella marina]MCX2975459.1 2Fe-2S iron-sulfur cluster binding domain-containing protein [Candidatus Seongchinamella marina]
MAHQVTVGHPGKVFQVEEGQTILDAALRSGFYLPHACSRGVCSACKIQIVQGEVDVGNASEFALMDSERDEGQCLACCASPLSDLTIEADVDEEPDAQYHTVRDYQGVVTSIKTLTPNIKSVFLALGDDGIAFQAGQYINLHIPGIGGGPRAFSIASPPSSNNIIELNVALIEGGEATHYIHNALTVGDVLSFSGPYGHFYLRKSLPEPFVFFAGGSGLSGVKSMIMELVEGHDPRPVTLIYGVQNEEDAYYRELFELYARERPGFTMLLAVNEPGSKQSHDGGWGYLQECANQHFEGSFEGNNAYVCGPLDMVDACLVSLIQGRCFEKHIFVENFYHKGSQVDRSKHLLFKYI